MGSKYEYFQRKWDLVFFSFFLDMIFKNLFLLHGGIFYKKILEKWPNVFTFLVGHNLIVKV